MNPKKPRTPCLVCGKEPYRSGYIYCSNKCQGQLRHDKSVLQWKEGKSSGLSKIGLVSKPIKIYLREKYQNRCCVCGWSKVNPYTGLVPLVADHIDGNWQNNSERNLRLICHNCDALGPTFAGANKGKGRKNRGPSKRALEARSLANDSP